MSKKYEFGRVALNDESNTIFDNVGIVFTPSDLVEFIEDYQFGKHKEPKVFLEKELSKSVLGQAMLNGLIEGLEDDIKPLRFIQKGLKFVPGITGKFFSEVLNHHLPPSTKVNLLPQIIEDTLHSHCHKIYFDRENKNEVIGIILELDLDKQGKLIIKG